MTHPLFTIEDLTIQFQQAGNAMTVVEKVGFEISRGETFALVGESGSGKSVTALGAMRLLPTSARILSGQVRLQGNDLLRQPEWQMNHIRGRRIAMIFQDPQTSLNPVQTIGRQIQEVLERHLKLYGKAARRRCVELLEQVGIPEAEMRIGNFPHQLSGGQRQRVMIAIALAGDPELLIADEPTTALDVTIQAQIMALLKRLQKERHMAMWLITHDLGLVADIADTAAVMQQGRIVETFNSADGPLFHAARHPYTRKLLSSLPRLEHCLQHHEEPSPPLLQVFDLKVWYPIRRGVLKRIKGYVKAVDGVSFTLETGKTLALVGESGCGKTTLGKALLQLIPITSGKVLFQGESIDRLSTLNRCRAMQIVFQDPFSAMNPRMLVGDIIAEGLISLYPRMSAQQRRQRVERLLAEVGLPASSRLRYPHEFSGGQRQRLCIARALAVEPRLIVCDEPTSALDVSVQKQIIDLLQRLQTQMDISYLFITHDLGVVAELADHVAVMYQGKILETGETSQVLYSPRHPYTQGLLSALPGKAFFSSSPILRNNASNSSGDNAGAQR